MATALGDKRGIRRYGHGFHPKNPFTGEAYVQGFTNEARCNLHLELYGDEPHHIVEALFKAFARAVDTARQHDPRIAGQLPSTKGKL